MLLELLLLGWSAIPTLRQFRKEHERLRLEQDSPHDNPYWLQIEATARQLGKEPGLIEQDVSEWMLRRPGKWLRYFRRNALLEEIGEFRKAGGRTALVSDYPAQEKLLALGCGNLFDVVIANGEEPSPHWLKPHPDGYLSAAKALNTPPERCLVLGDRPDADGQAAQRANMAYRRIG